MDRTHAPRMHLGTLAVRVSALWILAGALFKLFIGSPNDLPPVVREWTPQFLGVSATLVFKLAIATELSISVPALLRPRLVWPFVVALFTVFAGILVPLALAGAASCGCFGSKVIIPPGVMLAIDGTLLLTILFTRPWRAQPARNGLPVLLGVVLVVAWVLPFWYVPSGDTPTYFQGVDGGTRRLPRFVEWHPEKWVGKPLIESSLAGMMSVDDYPQDATWILYSPTCDHCAAYLRRVAGEFELDPKLYVLVELPGDEGHPEEVDLLPPGEHASLPTETIYFIETPWVLEVAGGVVLDAVHPEDED